MNKKEAIAKLIKKTGAFQDGNVSLVLESYNDIFSDFDPRSYLDRSLSEDFLSECNRSTYDKKPGFEIHLLVPKATRDPSDENKIKKRLRAHFLKHYLEKASEQKKIKKEGLVWFVIGALFILAATYFSAHEDFLRRFLLVLFEPAGWFTLWSGLEKFFFRTKDKLPEYHFYKRMAHAKILFYSLED